jgi:iron complex outermembrane receptor protein
MRRVALLSMAACAIGLYPVCASAAEPGDAVAGGAETTVEQVIVTAEKREQKLLDVPISISVYTSKTRDDLGIYGIQEIADFTPGLTYNDALDRTYIRGIGREWNRLTTDAGVAIYSDGVYTTSAAEINKPPLFVDRVEVLEGPQGTLYGRNAIGGAINIISAKPTATPYAEVRLEGDSRTGADAQVAIAGPLTDRLRVRVQGEVYGQAQSPFLNLATGQRGSSQGWYADAQAEYDVNDHSTLWMKLGSAQSASFNGGTGNGGYNLAPYDTTECGNAGCKLFVNANYGFGPGITHTQIGDVTQNPQINNIYTINAGSFDGANPVTKDVLIYDLSYTYHFSNFDVKYTGGYDQYTFLAPNLSPTGGPVVQSITYPVAPRSICAFYELFHACGPKTILTGGQFEYNEHNLWTSHEIDVSSTGHGPLQWIAGGYFYYEHYHNPETFIGTDPAWFDPKNVAGYYGGGFAAPPNPGGGVYSFDYRGDTRSLAGFGQVDWKIVRTVKLTGGLRYTRDDKAGVEGFRELCYSPTCQGGDPTHIGTLGNDQALDITEIGAASYATQALAQAVQGVTTPVAYDAQVARLPGKAGLGWIDYTIDPLNGDAMRSVKDHWGALTGTAGIEWTPDSDTNLYFRFSRGYKSGGFNLGEIQAAPEVAPEHVNAYEIGLKKQVGPGFYTTLAAYYYDYQNLQIDIYESIANVNQAVLRNIPTAVSAGVEWNAVLALTRNAYVMTAYSYDDAHVTAGCPATGGGGCAVDILDPLAVQPGAQQAPGAPVGVQSLRGDRLPQTPRNKVSVAGGYTLNFEPGSLTFTADYLWRDYTFGDIFSRSYNMAPSWGQVNLGATWRDRTGRWTIIARATNVTGALTYPEAGQGMLVAPDAAQPTVFKAYNNYYLGTPRTYSLQVYYKFF